VEEEDVPYGSTVINFKNAQVNTSLDLALGYLAKKSLLIQNRSAGRCYRILSYWWGTKTILMSLIRIQNFRLPILLSRYKKVHN
jgi:hypothetical protein